MRKKITLIFVISILAITFLTGCSKQIKSEEFEKMNEIAKNLKEVSDYKLDDGYTFSYPNKSSNSMVAIEKDDVSVIYDMSKETPELVSINVEYYFDIFTTIWVTFLITCVLALLFLAVIVIG